METIHNIKDKIIRCFTGKIQIRNINKLFEFIFYSQTKLENEDIEKYIFETKKEVNVLYENLLSYKKKKKDFDFFYLILDKIELEIKNTNNASSKDFLLLMSYYYYSIESTYQEIIFEIERNSRVNIDYPIEAYNYKANIDSMPLKSNAFYAQFHII